LTAEKDKMADITTVHKAESCKKFSPYTTCTYLIKGGEANQLGFEFPLKAVNIKVMS
jgi:hypothetical protein